MANSNKKQGKTPKELVQKHIADKDDIISEDEFKNMLIGTDFTAEIMDNIQPSKEEDNDSLIPSSWNVIS